MSSGAMHCAYCGRPAVSLVWINGRGYHSECLRGPNYSPQAWSVPTYQPVITEDRIREIVREEISRAAPEPKPAGGAR